MGSTPEHLASSFWKKPKTFRLKRQSVESAASLIRSYRRKRSEPSSPSSAETRNCPHQTKSKHVPIVVAQYDPIVAPDSPCTFVGLSSSRRSTIVSNGPHLSGVLLPSRKFVGDSSSTRPRHVEIVIQDWVLPVQRFSSSPINLPFDFDELQTPATPKLSPGPGWRVKRQVRTGPIRWTQRHRHHHFIPTDFAAAMATMSRA